MEDKQGHQHVRTYVPLSLSPFCHGNESKRLKKKPNTFKSFVFPFSPSTLFHEVFYEAAAFNGDVSTWTTSRVISMKHMFFKAAVFNRDISEWDTSNVIEMSHMFLGAEVFDRDVSKWQTSSVSDMTQLFKDANAFNSDISKWDISSVIEMNQMFENSGFQRTLCGVAWARPGNNLPSTGRLGCCQVGGYIISPEENPFVFPDSCSLCPPGRFTEDTSCTCPYTTGTSCTKERNEGTCGVDDISCKYCPKGYESIADDTTKCQICSFSKVRFISQILSQRNAVTTPYELVYYLILMTKHTNQLTQLFPPFLSTKIKMMKPTSSVKHAR